ncbi:cyclase family protein [Pseudodesulfovibrio sp. JC047]|uniref:cyclase family protein n=1 Tax=Pseudodesulfovibrio sp. JC047 TaxID=2683199 RepID=UPI0013D89E8F|nr:cyclase family protein [Pseudodesulfovibrio sp. JC047]NDV20623.1 cyclase family protein [Pseudodesulfovibrio sp. JC047]
MQLVDLTHTMQTGMPVFPGDEPANIRRTHCVNRDGFAQNTISFGSHTGTHLDTAAHVFADAPGLDWLGPDNFVGWGAVVDVSTISGPTIEQSHLAALADMDALDFAILRTGWDQHWATDRYFGDFPIISETAARFLGGLGLKGIGLDTPSPDPVNSSTLPAHTILLDHGLVIVENLTNIGELPTEGFIFSCLPLRIKDGEGSPVRAVGMTL